MSLYVVFEVSMAAEGLYLKIPERTSHTLFTEMELRNLGKSGNHESPVRLL